ncbi:MAG: pyridoxamine 5'-phosphate oxidase family protein [Ramlibacter sp.]|nr:pyridoxamine 5'-phosphate oxidase family protein [Ramlibacter sp.]
MAATFHEGEVALQERAGSRAKLAEIGPRVIRDHMPDQHREFFAQLPFVVVGTVDPQGQPWASVLAGEPGFVASPDPRRLLVQARPLAHDPLAANLADGVPIGLLGIEPHTRRRNRLNGWVAMRNEEGFELQVGQSFGNCPKYIQARRPQFTGAPPEPRPVQVLGTLDAAACELIARADTFFIATAHPQAGRADAPAFGVDVSHRGGKPGFVRVDGNVLTVPDFIGNAFFNTLGNLAVNPRCGLLFMDFDTADLLHVAARGEIVHDGPEVQAFQGAQRLMRFHVVSALRLPAALPLRWGEAELSPVLEATGAWR